MKSSALLCDTPILFVDCQTTGATPQKGELLDLAWTVASASGTQPVIEASLLAIEGELPRRIARITGVAPTDIEDTARPPQSVREDFLSVLAEHDGPVVAHYARFEQRFLDDFLNETSWDHTIVCTHAIARRLLPDLPRLGIRALSGYFGTSMDEEKRAQGHVAATVRIWRELVEMLGEERVETIDALKRWLETTAKPARSARVRRFPLPREQRLALPETPGVYRMLGRDKVVLYVGKATSLKARVNSYYRGKKGEGERKLELVTQVWDLDITPTETPLHAAILEQREIKTHQPSYNRQFRTLDRQIVWVDPSDLSSCSNHLTERHTLGPLPSARSLDGAIWLQAALAGKIEPLSFVEIDSAIVTEGLQGFLSEVSQLGFEKTLWADPFAIAELGARFRELDEVECDDDESEEAGGDHPQDLGDPNAEEGWSAEDVSNYARWVVKGVERIVRRARTFRRLWHGNLEWCSPVTSEQCSISWRSGRISETPTGACDPSFTDKSGHSDVGSYDETAVIIGELKRLVRQHAELSLTTPDSSFDRGELERFFSARFERQ